MKSVKKKIIVLLGPTACGKTDLSLKLAKKSDGFVISADSRQIYQGMDIATGKVPGQWKIIQNKKVYVADSIPHFLIDVVNPDQEFTLADWQSKTLEILNNPSPVTQGRTPFIVGGTGLYSASIVQNYVLPKGTVDSNLRQELEAQELPALVQQLKKVDPTSHSTIDIKNKRRVIRALEFAQTNQDSFSKSTSTRESPFEFLQFGITVERAELIQKINARVDEMFEQGIVEETQTLLEKYSIDLPALSGIGYPEIAAALAGKITMEAAKEKIKINTRQYAKRQLTWFKRDNAIQWITSDQEAEEKISTFLKDPNPDLS